MSDIDKQATNANDAGVQPNRRELLKTALAIAVLPAAAELTIPRAFAQAAAATNMPDFHTAADVVKAEKEGEVVFYTHDSGAAAAAICAAFSQTFPRIKARYVSAQNGALFSKVLAERSASRFDVDVIQFSELATAIDFQKRGGYALYQSPQASAYAAQHLSSPAGYYFWIGLGFAGVAYNTDHVSATDAPKQWKDLLAPRWKNAVSVKQATSGMQFVEWYELRKLYGEEFWKRFTQQQPRGFDSRVQLYDRLARGDDKVTALGEWAGYALAKQKKAPIAFVAPTDGLPASPMATGVVEKAPHPEAARLFLDWLMSIHGQTLYQTNPYLMYGSIRKDAPPMPGNLRLADFKLLVPSDMATYQATRMTFNTEWNAMLGLL
jgi:iron(III) transport system substrate-binding protein